MKSKVKKGWNEGHHGKNKLYRRRKVTWYTPRMAILVFGIPTVVVILSCLCGTMADMLR